MATQQQTVLRVQFDNVNTTTGITQYEFLDLYGDIPIKISKSFAELQDISKRNSDYSIGLQLPGSKKNNRFFENFFEVDTQSLYFNATKRVPCQVLLNDESYFTGYMRLNKTSVMESKVEYDVTLYSSIGDLFGNIGNNLLNELNFNDTEYTFNHTFDQYVVTDEFDKNIFLFNQESPIPFFYPIVHNGYEYTGDTVNLSGATVQDQTRLYTTSSPLSGYTSQAAAWAAGVKQYRLNSPGQGILDNQLKPALNIWNLIKLMFKTYGYTIKSDFFNTPWFKALYMYGYFSSDRTKFGYNMPAINVLPLEGVQVILVETFVDSSEYPCGTQYIKTDRTYTIYVVKSNSGIPCYCSEDINLVLDFIQYPCNGGSFNYSVNLNIPANSTGTTYSWVSNQYVDCGYGCPFSLEYVVNLGLNAAASNVSESSEGLAYLPIPAGTFVTYQDGDTVDFSLVISDTIKQIDLLSSIAKKFNLVFVPDPENKNQIIIEPYNYYIGTGDVHDWSDKISWDKGFTVEPALNYIESQLTLTDQEDGDYGNQEFKARNNRIYGQNIVYNPTDFKSQEKKIDTIFSPELIRTWDDNIALPLGINYAGSSQTVESGGSESLAYIYKGLKTKPKLMFWLGGFNPFLNIVGEAYPYSGASAYPTYNVWVSNSNATSVGRFEYAPIISHTMPIGNPDSNKINNDSLCNLFNSEEPISVGTTTTYNAYTENDIYSIFYQNRIDNLYNPNTRFLSGYFNLKYNDIKNLKPNDLIKINEQYFTWNKIDGFNLTNPELSKVELIQANNNPSEYPTRYFAYYYCDNPSICYKFKTDFTNPNLRDTNYFWSILYDYYVGILGGNVSGFTSSFAEVQNYVTKYIPYFMYEISKDDYNTSTCSSWDCDTLHNYLYEFGFGPTPISFTPGFWFSSGINDLPPAANTKQGLNVYSGCTEFASAVSTYGITTGSSTYHGSTLCPTPTPTPTVTPTNTPFPSVTPTQTMTVTPTPSPLPPYVKTAGDFYQFLEQDSGKVLANTTVQGLRFNSNGGFDTSYASGSTPTAGVVVDKISSTSYIYGVGGLSWNGVSRLGMFMTDQNGNIDGSFTSLGFYKGASTYGATPFYQSSVNKIVAGGAFENYNGVTHRKICRLNMNGTEDTSWVGTGFESGNYSPGFFQQSDDKILAWTDRLAADFAQGSKTYNGTQIYYLTRINANGSIDSTFNSNIGVGPQTTVPFWDPAITSVFVQSDGKIIVCGYFNRWNGTSVSQNICRLNSNGTLDTSFNSGQAGFSDYAHFGSVFGQQSSGKLLMVLNFPGETYNGTVQPIMIRLNTNGTKDTTFVSQLDQLSGGVETYGQLVLSDDTIIVGTTFGNNYPTKPNWYPAAVKLSANGSLM